MRMARLFVGKPDSPCRGCLRRKLNCHGICEEYRSFREAVDAGNRERDAYYRGQYNTADTKNRNAIKYKRYRWKLRKG